MKQTFAKTERLCSHYLIKELFANGSVIYLNPFRINWLIASEPQPSPVQILISVPKYNFRKAVHRNLIRRRIREAYRLNKMPFTDYFQAKGRSVTVGIKYTAKEIIDYAMIEAKIILLLQRLIEENEKVNG